MVALEALACGTPVAATDVGGIRQLLGHSSAGQIARGFSPETMAEAVAAALARRGEERERLMRRSLVLDYDWNRVAERMLREYQAALETGPAQDLRKGEYRQ